MAIIGLGATLAYGDDGVTFGTTITNIMELEVPEPECSDIDTTHLGVANSTRTFIAGLIDPGEMTFTIQFDKAQHAALYALLRVTKYFRITVDDGTTDSKVIFQGYFKKLGGPTVSGPEEIVMSTGTIKVTGLPVFTAGS